MEMKGIVHIRVDARLIHGQVAAIWSHYLKLTRIMVIDNEIAADEMQKKLLRMVAPAGVCTSIISEETALSNIKSGKYENQRVLILIKSPETINFLRNNGMDIKTFNVGNMATRDNTRQITKSISVTPKEEEILKELIRDGVRITVQMVPNESVKNMKDILNIS